MIVDASVALKWLVAEDDSELAMQLLETTDLAAPDFLLAEVANAIWRKQRKREIDVVPAFAAMLANAVDLVASSPVVAERALQLSIELGHPVYDCFYAALAEHRADRLVTADGRFIRACAGHPVARLVVGLSATLQSPS